MHADDLGWRRSKAMQRWGTAVVLAAATAGLVGCGEPTPIPTPTPAPVVVETGGTALSLSAQGSEMSGSPAGLAEPDVQAGEASTAATPDALAASNQADTVIFNAGDEVAARGVVRVYPEASPRAQAMGEYKSAATFVVIEPGADYAGYPVEINEVRWYRVRAEDGLVGWVMADGVEQQSE
jgi:hypothetical protein